MKFFPLEAGLTELRGVIEILKDSGGKMNLAKLSDETQENIDKLLPLLEAGSLLGLIKIGKNEVVLTPRGKKLTLENLAKTLSNEIAKIEPFRTAIKIIEEKGPQSTYDLVRTLRKKGVKSYSDEALDVEAVRNLLIKWGIRSKIFEYDYNTDMWYLSKS